MATGDLLAAIVNRDGRLLHLRFEGLGTGGTYLFGAGTSAVYSDRTGDLAKVVLAVTSNGYNSSASAVTKNRTVYGAIDETMPYGDAAARWIQSGTMTGQMQHGETITQAVTGATATVVTNCPCAPLICRSVSGTPDSSNVWTGGTSGATFAPSGTPVAYSAAGVKREGVQGSDLWIAVALDEYIYSDCTATVTLKSAVYTKTGTPTNAATAFAVTNSSAAAHAKVILRWATVPYQIIKTPTFTIRAIGYHRMATNGQPLACVKFSATDGTTTREVIATSMTTMEGPNTGLHVPVYEATFTSAEFTDNAVITCNCIGYPHVGNSSALTDSSLVSAPSTSLSTLPMFNDYDDDFGTTIAYVDQRSTIATSDSLASFVADETLTQTGTGATAIYNHSGTGLAYVTNVVGTPNSSGVWTGGTSGATFTPTTTPTALGSDARSAYDISNDATARANPQATIGGAMVAIKAFNNTNRSRNNCDGGIVYLMKGNHRVAGGTTGSTLNAWVTITKDSTLADGEAKIRKRAGVSPTNIAIRHLRFLDCDFNPIVNDALTVWDSGAANYVWLDGCRFTASAQVTDSTWAVVHGYPFRWCTSNTVERQANTGTQDTCVLSMDNSCNGTHFPSSTCDLGNYTQNRSSIFSDTTLDNVVIAHNRANRITTRFYQRTSTCSHGIAIIGNEAETISGTSPNIQIFADGSTVSATNVCLAHNTATGERNNWCYNDVATGSNRINCHSKYNSLQWHPHKFDTFSLAQTSCLCYPVTYGAGHAGNNSEATSDAYPFRWGGWLETRQTAAGYVNDLSKTTTGAGYGNYTPQPSAAIVGKVITGEAVWPYDLAGNAIPNNGTGNAGANQFASSGGGAANLLLMGVG